MIRAKPPKTMSYYNALEPEYMSSFEIEPFSYFQNKYMPNLREPSCVPASLTELCSGWYQETFKQIMNKLSKNKTAPFPLYFTNTESMEQISQKRQVLKEIFTLMDTRELKRIDASELYAIIMFLAKSDYDSFLRCMVDVFGLESSGHINKGELFFFLDSMFRSFSKFLIIKTDSKPNRVNVRLDSNSLHKWVAMMFKEEFISKQEIGNYLQKVPDLNQFLKYVYLKMAATSDWAKEQSIKNMKIDIQVKAVMRGICEEVQKALKNPKT